MPEQINVGNSNRSRSLRGGFADNQFVFLGNSHNPELQKKYLKPVDEETIVPDGLRMLVPQFVEGQSTKFRGDLKISLNDKQNSL